MFRARALASNAGETGPRNFRNRVGDKRIGKTQSNIAYGLCMRAIKSTCRMDRISW